MSTINTNIDEVDIGNSNATLSVHVQDYFEKQSSAISLRELDKDCSTPLTGTLYGSPIQPDFDLKPDRSVSNSDISTDSARLHTLTTAIKVMISCLDPDSEREGLLKSPERYAKALLSFTEGYQIRVADVVNDAIFHEETNEDMVIVKDIEVFSLCEHHIVPFMGKIHIGYIPNGRVIGLSKIARIVEVFARRLQIQERITRQVAIAMKETLDPLGVAVVMESSHLCMVMRGVQKTSSSTTTSCMLGSFKTDADLRKEFLALVNRK